MAMLWCLPVKTASIRIRHVVSNPTWWSARARTHTHTHTRRRNIRNLVYFLFRKWKFVTNRSAYEMNTSWALVLVATTRRSRTKYAYTWQQCSSLIYNDAARHTTLFCRCKLGVQRNTTCLYKTHANSCHYVVYLLVSKHEWCTHYVRDMPNLNYMTLHVYSVCGSETTESHNTSNIPETSVSQTWTIQQWGCHHKNFLHFPVHSEGQFVCRTNTYTHDPRSPAKSPLQAHFIRRHVPISATNFAAKHISRKYRGPTSRSCSWPGGRPEARTVQHASSLTSLLQVQVSQMEIEPRGTARLSLTLPDIICIT